MARLFRSLPPGPALIVGADIPALARCHVARSFAALGAADAVLGPATDGGFWGIGLRRVAAVPSGIFEGVRWSGAHALDDTARTLPERLAFADLLDDVDTASDLDRAGTTVPAGLARLRGA
jgi:hypothetical protein